MIDIKFLRETPDLVKKSIKDRQMTNLADVDEAVKIDKQFTELLREVESLRNQKNEISNKIVSIKDSGEKETILKQATTLKKLLAEKETELNTLQTKLNELLMNFPNMVHESVPYGKDDSENKPIRKWGTPNKFKFAPKDHIELGKLHNLIDTDSAATITGSRFAYLKNELALMQFAIIQFVFQTLTNPKIIKDLADKVGNPNPKPFTPIVPPVMIKPTVMNRMARLHPIEERYYIPSDDVVLVGSAEHTLGPLFMDQVINEKDLPIRYIGYSTAFRREAGSYGKDIQGIIRQHQFDKLEMETFCMPENGLVEQDLLVAVQEYLLQQLEIPYQVVAICTGDMGKPDYRQIDLEAWMPGQDKYREVQTSDYMTDFQSRRLNTRYNSKYGRGYVFMNDATALAIGRTLVAIMENYQQEDGSIKIPKVLHQYMAGITQIGKTK